MTDIKYETVVLAALLHDIGKFRQRTGLQIADDYELQNNCPKNDKNIYSHYHAAHTGVFLKNLAKDHFPLSAEVIWVAASHHLSKEQYKGDNHLEALYAIVKKADHFASGLDREAIKAYDTETEDTFSKQQANFITSRLESIFDQIYLDNESKNTTNKSVLAISKLSPTLNPANKDILAKEKAQEQYLKLWVEFEKEFRSIDFSVDFEQLYATILSVLETYTWCIPASSYKNYPNVSLFDHQKTCTAFASALYAYHKHNDSLNYDAIMKNYDNESRMCLVQGDFAGIQNFIFDVKGHEHSAKILRARSFFVSIATELAAYKLCKSFGVSMASVVMNAGGKFTILAPNIPDIANLIENCEREINEHFKELTFDQTRLTITSLEMQDFDFYTHLELENNKKTTPFTSKYSELVTKLETKKISYVIDTPVFPDYIETMTAKDGGVNEEGLCSSCYSKPKRKAEKFCEFCEQFSDMGKKLVKSETLSIYKEEVKDSFAIIPDFFIKLQTNVTKIDSSAILTYRIKDGIGLTLPMRRYAGNLPIQAEEDHKNNYHQYATMSESQFDNNKFEEGLPKTFSHLACNALKVDENNDVYGKAVLGVLKADIDNLGLIFSQGFGRIATFSMIASLSRMLDYFFSTIIIDMIKDKDIYTVFAGGDDLFLIGAWDQIVELAGKINNRFRKYTANHINFSISMGITLAKPNIPVQTMANMAEEQLEFSKANINKQGLIVKNTFSMFGETLSWNEEFKESFMFKNRLSELLKEKQKEKQISIGYVYKLLSFVNMAGGKEKRDLMWKPLFHYLTCKNYKNLELQKELLTWVDIIEQNKTKLIIPISIALYEQRNK